MVSHHTADALRVYQAPSTLAIAVAATILGAVGGYFVGQGMSLLGGRERVAQELRRNKRGRKRIAEKVEILESDEEDKEDTEEEEEGGKLKEEFEGHEGEECKLMLVVRTDLGMTKG